MGSGTEQDELRALLASFDACEPAPDFAQAVYTAIQQKRDALRANKLAVRKPTPAGRLSGNLKVADQPDAKEAAE